MEPPHHRLATRTILAVDGDRANLNQLGHRLGQLGYLVVLSDRGSEALDLIEGRRFDLVLLDRDVPEPSGLRVLHEIRGARDSADLPVVMIAHEGGRSDAAEALAAGADDYVVRPFEFEVLAARIERILTRAARLDALKRSNLALDARIAARAIELGEVRAELAAARARIAPFSGTSAA